MITKLSPHMKDKSYVTAYVPLVHGQPARFCNDYQLCVGGSRAWYVEPVPTLREVRKQIDARPFAIASETA